MGETRWWACIEFIERPLGRRRKTKEEGRSRRKKKEKER
jgi:hypothetical protein